MTRDLMSLQINHIFQIQSFILSFNQREGREREKTNYFSMSFTGPTTTDRFSRSTPSLLHLRHTHEEDGVLPSGVVGG